MAKVMYDPRWSLPNVEDFLRGYMLERGCDIEPNFDFLGDMAVRCFNQPDDQLQYAMAKTILSYTKSMPKGQEVLAQASGGVKPLHISTVSEADLALEADWEEIEREASEQFVVDGDFEESTTGPLDLEDGKNA